jgi:hypothetical protein
MHSFGSNEPEVFPNPANIFRQQEPQNQEPQNQEPQNQEPQNQEPQNQEQQIQEPKPSEPSICIPRVFKSVTRKELYDVIERVDLGAVDRIDMVPKVNVHGESYNKVFIHFKKWNRNPLAQAARAKLLQGEEIKIVYSEPWFWKCTASRVDKPTFRDYLAPPPRIDLGGCKSMSVLTTSTATHATATAPTTTAPTATAPTTTAPTTTTTATHYDDIPCYD